MPRLTAIELSGDACVLVAVRVRGAAVRIEQIEILDPSAFPGDGALGAALSGTRRTHNFPKRARVVLWGLPDGASPDEPSVSPRLSPLVDAGFRIDRVVSPQNALAALARLRIPKPESATVWLAIDRSGVALVASRPGELLYSHAFSWNSSVGATGSQARLLQRYSLVAFLAPEVRRALASVHERGGRVDTLITCGTLPELRSLTMPLIEELDVEVETLDFLNGIDVDDAARERAVELAPAIRLACAGAVTRPSRFRDAAALVRPHTWLRAAAVIALLVLAGTAASLWAWRHWRRLESKPVASNSIVTAPATVHTPAPASQARADSTTGSRQHGTPPSQTAVPTTGTPSPAAAPKAAPDAGVRRSAHPREEEHAPAPLSVSPVPADNVRAAPLKDPLPNISTILVSESRRLAVVDGRIVSVGDKVGRRTVAEIEPHAVRFREPSGLEIRVGLGGGAARVPGFFRRKLRYETLKRTFRGRRASVR